MRPIARAIASALRTLGIDQDVARADAVRAWPAAATTVLGADAVTTRAVRTGPAVSRIGQTTNTVTRRMTPATGKKVLEKPISGVRNSTTAPPIAWPR